MPKRDSNDGNAHGTAGGSARAEYERRERRRKESVQAERSRLSRVVRTLKGQPQSNTAWAKGAVGEQRVGALLDPLGAAGAVVLHDRRVPGTRANIDHVVVAPSGVWVIDTKHYSGRVEAVDRGGWFRTDLRLFVGGRDRTKLVRAMWHQVDVVKRALVTADVPIRPVLCFTGAEWSIFAKPFVIDGVMVTWTKPLVERIARSDDSGVPVLETSQRIAAHLPSAS